MSLKSVVVGPGNNSRLVKNLATARPHYFAVEDVDSTTVLVWTQLPREGIRDLQLKQPRLLHNHIHNSFVLTQKKHLFQKLQHYCRATGSNLSSIVPETFHIQQPRDVSAFLRATDQARGTWIIKPGEDTNRGTGIRITDSLQELQAIVTAGVRHCNGSPMTFVVQRYIANPLLYCGRKFDIRMFMVLISRGDGLKAYWYE
jgi:hypothetical protein